MIVAYGELIMDTMQERNENKLSFFLGGAPFNMAYSVLKMGEKSLCVGNVGDDFFGHYFMDKAKEMQIPVTGIRIDKHHNTTVSFVSHDQKGNPYFTFARCNTADDNFLTSQLGFLQQASLVHLGSLPFSTMRGRKFYQKVIQKAKENNIPLSFDINYRSDIFTSQEEALNIYSQFYPQMDIVKFSQSELRLFSGTNSIQDGLKKLKKGPKFYIVTLGEKGCVAYLPEEGKFFSVPPLKVHAIDATGAGDSFFGTLLSQIDHCGFSSFLKDDDTIKNSLRLANIVGALSTTKKGSLNSIPSYQEALSFLK